MKIKVIPAEYELHRKSGMYIFQDYPHPRARGGGIILMILEEK